MKIVSQKEVDNVVKLSPVERYKYALKWIADGEVIYTLTEDGEFEISEVDGHQLFPVWSAPVFAELFAVGEWGNCKVQSFTLAEFESGILPLINENDYLLNVFPVNGRAGFVVELDEFLEDLDKELDYYK
ncbi:Protein of unknown function [Chitinophaga terrae (ex Kim and Jung 2007)]|uniref:DUF2750 domain-containing protein n=1 Tax=Chitinophaga terrae (ex Kim and Jung 2007) TaxID=408074 RepID=A0A1H4CGJ0_9BACT|nr:DUF2750 domain-containing protein [Chitinophaga terrae (ex Kim and Jung 2007)]MDQ0109451.1 hypothetical protein [Chitinophaga terrae (ex Kim and Jung 2007)]GEP88964.1 hypothetical protein CTE07_06090 [Chitinophaga terrae (ex Kim and Jung 2007)]SEA59478.1 Protein of unknown function [Chitinophaga terrae (ex Kim and Jung 2007)]